MQEASEQIKESIIDEIFGQRQEIKIQKLS